MDNSTLPQKGFTLEELLLFKEETRKNIIQQEQRIVEVYHEMISPITNMREVSNYIGGRIIKGIALFESILWGYRIVSRMIRIFRKKQ